MTAPVSLAKALHVLGAIALGLGFVCLYAHHDAAGGALLAGGLLLSGVLSRGRAT